MPLDRKRVFAVYSEVLEIDEPARDAALSGLCAGDAELEAEVRALLSAQSEDTFALSAPVEAIRNDYWRSVADDDPEASEDLSGERIGRWQLEQRVGRGGLATVYRATRADGEFTQTAAFKVMRRGLDSEDLIRRFRAERQILAGLGHPGIAGILDGGTLPDGRPFLVLEFVDGMDIVSWTAAKHPETNARLDLIDQVADALHHAHQRLVVHRDVKPSNVMVTGDGTVRLLDFGIARLLDVEDSPVAARLTRTGVRMLTPAYGTPEQNAGTPVTTASDVYQLGLLMAEVLSGNRPVQNPEEAAIPDLTGLVDRDLRAIIEKATRPEPDARYPSILSLKDDLHRYRQNEPVLARAGSWRYRAGKFIRRRPLLVPGLAVGALVVAAYVVTLTIYSRELAREQAIATTSQSFLIRLFESPNPRAPADPGRGRRITVLEALEIGRANIDDDLAGQPAVEAALSRTLSAVYAALSQYEPAIEMRERALALERTLHGPASSEALESMRALTRLQAAAGDQAAADALAREQLALARESASDTEIGMAEYAAGEQAIRTGQAEEGTELMESAISGLLEERDVAASVDVDALRALLSEAASGADPSAQILAAESLIRQSIDGDSPAGLILQAQIAASLADVGDVETAEARYLQLIPKMEQVLGPLHPDTLSTRNILAVFYSGQGRHEESEAVQRALLPDVREVHGAQSLSAANTLQNLATAISRQGPLQRGAHSARTGTRTLRDPAARWASKSCAAADLHGAGAAGAGPAGSRRAPGRLRTRPTRRPHRQHPSRRHRPLPVGHGSHPPGSTRGEDAGRRIQTGARRHHALQAIRVAVSGRMTAAALIRATTHNDPSPLSDRCVPAGFKDCWNSQQSAQLSWLPASAQRHRQARRRCHPPPPLPTLCGTSQGR